jgi:hypothetical protein
MPAQVRFLLSNSEQRIAASRPPFREASMQRRGGPGPSIGKSLAFAAAAPRPHPISPAPLPPSSAPTREYRRHHDVAAPQVDSTAFRQGWRVTTRLGGLLDAGRIDREAWDAAQQWRRWAEVVTPFRAQAWDVHVEASLVPSDGGMLLRVNAAAQLRAVADALGQLRMKLLEAVVMQDVSWLELGRLLRCSDKTAQNYACEALEALSDWHAGRAIAAPPVLRYRNQPSSL